MVLDIPAEIATIWGSNKLKSIELWQILITGGGVTIRPSTLRQIRQFVDTIYELTSGTPYGGTFKDETKRFRDVSAILVKRGIVRCDIGFNGKNKRLTTYSWVAPMAPTDVLYKSIAQEIVDRERKHNKTYRSKHFKKEDMSSSLKRGSDGVDSERPDCVFSIKDCSAQELWDEIKRRGYTIEDNRLVKIQKEYLE